MIHVHRQNKVLRSSFHFHKSKTGFLHLNLLMHEKKDGGLLITGLPNLGFESERQTYGKNAS